VRDWYVFEAASWALASQRIGDARTRERWREPLPATELADRLRQLPLFSQVGVDELFRLAAAGRQGRHESGRVLLQEGAAVEAAHVLLDGTLRSASRAHGEQLLNAPAALGLRETLEGHPAEATIRAEGTVVTLAIPSEEIGTLLADNQDLIDGLLRTFAGSAIGTATGPVLVSGGGAADLLARAADGVLPVHKVLVLQRLPLFSLAASPEMIHAAAIARLHRANAGDTIAAEGRAPAIHYVLSGELVTDPAELVADPGDAFGVYETLAGHPIGRVIRATKATAFLTIDRDDLLDLLGHRPALAQQVFASLFVVLQRATEAEVKTLH
jgi:CRP-like cAMP-binding protein